MKSQSRPMDQLKAIMDRLLAPDGCPWDREQTHESLLRYLIEESYEVVDAVKIGDMEKFQEELGDLLLQVVFHSAIAEREGFFNLDDVARTVSNKMINRHPHVFGDLQLKTSGDVLDHWEGFKKKEGKTYLLSGIPPMMPALLRALKIQEKAARVGFDWPSIDGAVDKWLEEVAEFQQAQTAEETKEELGDLFFALVNIARLRGVEPEDALQGCNDKFTRRFNYMEDMTRKAGQSMNDLSLEELDRLWDEAKGRGL